MTLVNPSTYISGDLVQSGTGVIPKPYTSSLSGNVPQYASKMGGSKKRRTQYRKKGGKSKKNRSRKYRK